MKHSFFIAAIVVGLLTGCSSAYKSTQTPDDVYYSPAQGSPESAVAAKQQDRYEQYMSSNDDRYLAMKVHNYNLWSPLDDYSYWYDSRYNYYNQFGWNYSMYSSPWYSSSYYFGNYGWGSWYNPVYIVACYKNPKVVSGSTSGSNITAYQNKNYNNSNYTYYNPKLSNNQSSSNTNSFGTLIRRTFTPASSYTSNNNSNSSNNSSYSNPVRVFTPTNSSTSSPATTSSSAGGSSGGYSSSGSSTSSGRGSRGN